MPRLTRAERHEALVRTGAASFAAAAYDDVTMEAVALRAGVSRALLYRHFPGKRELFAAVYQRAADELLEISTVDPEQPLLEQVRAGLEAHIDYFLANRLTVLTANRTLAGDPVVSAIITDELAVLRDRVLAAIGEDDAHEEIGAALTAWLVFVRVLSVEWLLHQAFDRDRLRDVCLGALAGALGMGVDPD